MSTSTPAAPVSKGARWTGYILGLLPTLLMLFSAYMKFAKPPGIEEGFTHLGFSVAQASSLGILEVGCLVIHWIPRTSVLGAILLAGYLGGATAIHVRVGDPFVMTPLIGVFFWAGLYLREPRLRALIPFRK